MIIVVLVVKELNFGDKLFFLNFSVSSYPRGLAHQLEGDEGNVAAYRHDANGHEKV